MRRAPVALCVLACSWAFAQDSAAPASAGIYTCVDAKGRKLTADRPIPECLDREQRVLNPSGTVKARIGPALTAKEREAQEEKARQAAEDQNRATEEKRRNRALVQRYPNQAMHDKERGEALSQVEIVIRAAQARIEELQMQRGKLDTEMEFYKKDPGKAPAALRRQIEELQNSLAVQQRFIADQETEKRRVNARFDEELARLRALWAAQATSQKP
ncbi:MAG: DUF4124 domain-containing protein [Rhodoferax sp.]